MMKLLVKGIALALLCPVLAAESVLSIEENPTSTATNLPRYLPKRAPVVDTVPPYITPAPPHRLYPRSIYAPQTILGTLPADFAPEVLCETPNDGVWGSFSQYATLNLLYGVRGTCGDVDSECFPPGFPYSTEPVETLPVYSPAESCPPGWTWDGSGTWYDDGSYKGASYLTPYMTPGEMLRVCCPSGWNIIIRTITPDASHADFTQSLDCFLSGYLSASFEVRACVTDSGGFVSSVLTSTSYTIPGDGLLGYAPAFGLLTPIENIAPATDSATPSFSPNALPSALTDTHTPDHKSSNTSTIVGATVGSIAGVALFLVAAFFIWRKKKPSTDKTKMDLEETKPMERGPQELDGKQGIQTSLNGGGAGYNWVDLSSFSAQKSAIVPQNQVYRAKDNSSPAELAAISQPFLGENAQVSELSGSEIHPVGVGGRLGVEKRYMSRESDTASRFTSSTG